MEADSTYGPRFTLNNHVCATNLDSNLQFGVLFCGDDDFANVNKRFRGKQTGDRILLDSEDLRNFEGRLYPTCNIIFPKVFDCMYRYKGVLEKCGGIDVEIWNESPQSFCLDFASSFEEIPETSKVIPPYSQVTATFSRKEWRWFCVAKNILRDA